MWDRLKITPHQGRPRGQVGHPLDDDGIRVGLGLSYGTLSATKGYSYSIKGGPAPPRPPREFFESRFETAPAVKEPPARNPKRITVRTAKLRPASSVYDEDSDHSPDYTANVATRHGYRYGGADDVSPPSSPEPDLAGADRFLPGDVSPIDEDDAPTYPYPRHAGGIPNTDHLTRNGRPDRAFAPAPRQGTQSPPQNRGTTSIPMLRRERRRQSDAATRDGGPSQRGPAQQQAQNPPGRDGPRWDPLTGEQTSSNRGRPSQVNPAEYAQGFGVPPQNQHPAAAAPPSFGDRVRNIAKRAAASRDANNNQDLAAGAFLSSRPGWRGASGRAPIVDPVRDTREVPPLRIPEKSARRNLVAAAAGPKSQNNADGPVRRGQTPPVSPPPSETPARSGPREALRRILPSSQPAAATQTPQPAQRYPSPPLSGNPAPGDAPAVAARELARDGLYGPRALPSPTFNSSARAPESPQSQPQPQSQIRRKPPPVHTNHHHQVSSVSSVYSQQTEAPQPSPLQIQDQAVRQAYPAEEPYVQPPSRFSISTYATSNTRTTRDDLDDPLDDDQPPVPSLPADYQQQPGSQTDGRPYFSDRHSPVTSPIDQFMTSPWAAPRGADATTTGQATTPTPSPPAVVVSEPPLTNPAITRTQSSDDNVNNTPSRPSSRASASDINKTLPPAPPEQSADESQDRVALLRARLAALANRRININRSVAQMTELMPTDALLSTPAVVKKREEEKRKVEVLRAELADVTRQEYELGLKLHRAYKRLDREAEWEGTALWVRRVTG